MTKLRIQRLALVLILSLILDSSFAGAQSNQRFLVKGIADKTCHFDEDAMNLPSLFNLDQPLLSKFLLAKRQLARAILRGIREPGVDNSLYNTIATIKLQRFFDRWNLTAPSWLINSYVAHWIAPIRERKLILNALAWKQSHTNKNIIQAAFRWLVGAVGRLAHNLDGLRGNILAHSLLNVPGRLIGATAVANHHPESALAYKRHHPTPIGTFQAGNKVYQLVLTRDGRLVSADYTEKITVHTVENNVPIEKVYDINTSEAHISPDGQYYVTPRKDRKIGVNIVRIETGETNTLGDIPVETYPNPDMWKDHVHEMLWSPDGTLIAYSHNNSIKVWNVKNRLLVKSLPIDKSVVRLAISPDNNVLATVSYGSHDILLWDLKKKGGTPKPYKVLKGSEGQLTALAFSPHDNTLAATSLEESLLYFWDIQAKMTEEPILTWGSHRDYTYARIAFAPVHYEHRTLLAVSSRSQIIDLLELTRRPSTLNQLIPDLPFKMTDLGIELAGSIHNQGSAYCLALTEKYLVSTFANLIQVWRLSDLIDFPLSDDFTPPSPRDLPPAPHSPVPIARIQASA
jgi:hypothetical protein